MVQKDKLVELAQPDPEPCPGGTEVGVVEVQSSVEEHRVVTERAGRRKFISGVVEGKFTVNIQSREMCFRQLNLSHRFCRAMLCVISLDVMQSISVMNVFVILCHYGYEVGMCEVYVKISYPFTY